MQTTDLYCQQCDSKFQRREHYQRHIRTHTKERPFSCTECGQEFGRIDSLSRHYNTVHQQNQADSSGERRRVAQACRPCNTSKVRCDGQEPCRRCQNNGLECFYSTPQKRRFFDQSIFAESPAKRQQTSVSSHHETDPVHWANQQDPVSIVTHDSFVPGPPSTQSVIQEAPTNLDLDPTGRSKQPEAAIDSFRPRDTQITDWESLLSLDMDLSIDLDASMWPDLLDPHPRMDQLDNIWLASMDPDPLPIANPVAENKHVPLPLTPTDVAEIYDQGCSSADEGEDIGPRQYHPTAINVDAQLTFPDMEQVRVEQVDRENFAHVREIGQNVVDEATKMASTMNTTPSFPPFLDLRVPPAPVINAWVQLYFEHFHPVFPFLHKPTFGAPGTHWFLVLTVSAIGAQFSQLPQAQTCARAMTEMVRRQSSYLCENQNKNGRELWLTQAILLNSLALRYSGERRELEIAELLQALPVTLARRKQLFANIMSLDKISQLDLSPNQRWQLWTLDEERRRTGFAVWLSDWAYQSHFDLTTLMDIGEMQNSLPQSEDRWAASSAQGWASFSLQPAVKSPYILEQVIADKSWTTTWLNTGVLGKQAILQLLTTTIINDHGPGQYKSSSRVPNMNRQEAQNVLKDLLATTEEDEANSSIQDFKANVLYQLTILSALIICNTPQLPLLSTALRVKYQRYSEEGPNRVTKEWNTEPQSRRLAVVYAARVFASIRDQSCPHFSTPVLLFRSTLVLWIYAALCNPSPQTSPSSSSSEPPSVVLGTPGADSTDQSQWIESGWGRVKLPGIGNIISSPSGRTRLLDEATLVMRSLRAWGISRIYGQLLARLRAEE